MKQKGDDYKITAVKYYLNNNDTMDLKDWIKIQKRQLKK